MNICVICGAALDETEGYGMVCVECEMKNGINRFHPEADEGKALLTFCRSKEQE